MDVVHLCTCSSSYSSRCVRNWLFSPLLFFNFVVVVVVDSHFRFTDSCFLLAAAATAAAAAAVSSLAGLSR